MKLGALISGVVAVGAAVGLTTVFIQNASPYATITEAPKYVGSNGVHIAGQLVPKTLEQDPMKGEVRFQLKDDSGVMNVVYTGSPVSNLHTATQVVVIGAYKEGTFHARDMLVKCPSKYESEKGSGKVNTAS